MKIVKKGKPIVAKAEAVDEDEAEVTPEIQELADWAEKAIAEEGTLKIGDDE
jgi:hypothetical protein